MTDFTILSIGTQVHKTGCVRSRITHTTSHNAALYEDEVDAAIICCGVTDFTNFPSPVIIYL